jgi:tRNA threonylcarbamoyladenosine biosynthesis protein TsaE
MSEPRRIADRSSAPDPSGGPTTAGSVDVVSHSAAQTQRLGAHLGALLAAGDVLLLEGGLGAGKTVFAQGIAQGLGVEDPVTSPTFVLVHEYEGRVPLYHADLYRLGGAAEATTIGLEEYLWGDGVTLIEWPDRALSLVPPDHLVITLRPISDTKRSIRLTPHGLRLSQVVEDFKRSAFGL